MTERPMHRIGCDCRQCRPPVEPTWRQLVVVFILLAVAGGLMLWR